MTGQAKQTQSRPRLGRGLSSLIVNTAPKKDSGTYVAVDESAKPVVEALEVSIDQIAPNPYQPRKQFDKQQLADLAESIRQQGVLQPLLLSPAGQAHAGGKPYVLVAGQRRLQAAGQAGLKTVPAIVRQASDEQILEWALIENIQREDLNAVERAQAFRDVIDRFELTQAQLAERLGTSRETVANYLRVLDLCDDVQKLLLAGRLTFGHARALAGLAGQADRQLALAKRVIKDQLSVRQLEGLLAADPTRQESQPAKRPARTKPPYISDLEQQLTQQIGTRVTISPGKSKHTGKMTIEYYSLEDFDRILSTLGASVDS